MARRMIVLMLAMLVVSGIAAPSALGWANGPDIGGVGNGKGTHDWVLEDAIAFAGSGGAWVDKDAALLASDDPDTYATNSNLHLFRDAGIGRGAPSEVSSLYYQAVDAYRDRRYSDASHYLGVLSHYYSDILQPFHTDYSGAIQQDDRHFAYELAVDKYQREVGPFPGSTYVEAREAVPDVRAKTVAAAYYSRGKYPSLIASLKVSSSVGRGTEANTVTGLVLNRASNDLADIISSIPAAAAAGPALTAASLSSSRMSIYYPAPTGKVCATTRLLNSAGKPIEGAAVFFSWPLEGGVVVEKAYTNYYGYAYDWQVLNGLYPMRLATVQIASNGTGISAKSSTAFRPSPILAAGSAGIRTTKSVARPKRRTNVTIATVVHDRYGHTVAGLPVTFYWRFKSGTISYKTVTNSRGVARSTRNIGMAARGYRVYVRAQTQSGGFRRSSTASFLTM